MNFQQLMSELETSIKNSYESGVTLDEAEKLAAKTLYAMMQISTETAYVDQDETVSKQQDLFDEAETNRDDLERMYSILKEYHVFMRGVSKARFD